MTDHLIAPHGGQLVQLLVAPPGAPRYCPCGHGRTTEAIGKWYRLHLRTAESFRSENNLLLMHAVQERLEDDLDSGRPRAVETYASFANLPGAGQWAVGADADRRLAKIVQEVARNIGWRPVDAGGD